MPDEQQHSANGVTALTREEVAEPRQAAEAPRGRSAESASPQRPHICPFCGTPRSDASAACSRCTMSDTSATRAATKQRIGPWYVLQSRTPSAPGMRFSTLLALVKRGQVTPRSVVRGPTTHQLWTYADRVRGLSREFESCWQCGQHVEPTATGCDACGKPQDPPSDPNALLETPDRRGPRPAPVPAVAMDDLHDHTPDADDLAVDAPVRSTAVAPRKPRPIRRPPASRPEDGDGLLSPKELAAAFQLNLPTQPGGSGSVMGTMVRGLLIVIILAMVAGGAVLVANEPMRKDVFGWFSHQYQAILASVPDLDVGETSPNGSPPTGIQPGAEADLPDELPPRRLPVREDGRESTAQASPDEAADAGNSTRGDVPAATDDAARAAEGRVVNQPTQAVQPAPPPGAAQPQTLPVNVPRIELPQVATPQPVREAVDEVPAEASAEVDLSKLSRSELAERQRAIRDRALDADAAGNWSESVRLWSQLAQMPADIRYTDAQVRLNNARQMLQRQNRSADNR